MLTPKKHTEMKAPHPLKCPPLSPILRYLLQKAIFVCIHVFKPVADILTIGSAKLDRPASDPSVARNRSLPSATWVRLSSLTQQSVDPEFSPQNSHMDYFGWGMLGSIVYWCLLFSNIAVSSCTYGHSFHSWPLPERILDVNWSDFWGLKVESQGATLKRPATHSWTSLQVPSSVQMCTVIPSRPGPAPAKGLQGFHSMLQVSSDDLSIWTFRGFWWCVKSQKTKLYGSFTAF